MQRAGIVGTRIGAELIRWLREHSIAVSLDRIGIGYASLSYLRHFAFDSLKIDCSLVFDVHQCADSATIVWAIIALAKSEKPERKQQGAGWRVFKASEAGPNGAAIYVFIMDPVAKGSEYSVGNILVEGFGAEGQTLYKTYSESYASPAIGALLHLTKVIELGK